MSKNTSNGMFVLGSLLAGCSAAIGPDLSHNTGGQMGLLGTDSTSLVTTETSAWPQITPDPGTGETTTGGGSNLEGGGKTECPLQELNFTPEALTVTFLIDQSESMRHEFDGTTRWDAVRRSLFEEPDGVVVQLGKEIQFGVSLYTSLGGNLNGDVCPQITSVAPQIDNLTELQQMYDGQTWVDDTPTGESIDHVVGELLSIQGRKIIVLATDGEPDTCAVPTPQNGQLEAVTAATDSHDKGIDLFVMSLGYDISEVHLQDMADAGSGVEGAPFYQPLDSNEMVEDFRDIVNGVRSCNLDLDVVLKLNKAHLGSVQVNGHILAYNDPNGWRVVDPRKIELLGLACDAIQTGEVDIRIDFPCDTYYPPAF